MCDSSGNFMGSGVRFFVIRGRLVLGSKVTLHYIPIGPSSYLTPLSFIIANQH